MGVCIDGANPWRFWISIHRREAIFRVLWISFNHLTITLYTLYTLMSRKMRIIRIIKRKKAPSSRAAFLFYAMSELVEEEVCDACLFSCRAIWMSCHSSSVRFSGRELSAGGAEFSLAGEAVWWQLSKLLILTFFRCVRLWHIIFWVFYIGSDTELGL